MYTKDARNIELPPVAGVVSVGDDEIVADNEGGMADCVALFQLSDVVWVDGLKTSTVSPTPLVSRTIFVTGDPQPTVTVELMDNVWPSTSTCPSCVDIESGCSGILAHGLPVAGT